MTDYFATPDGFRIAWHDLGGPRDGIPVILQHGFTANTESEWVACGIAASVVGLGRHVISVDALGHGASDKPHDRRHYGEVRMARDVSGIATELGFARYDLVGYSMGAIVAAIGATEDRRIRRLVLGGVGEAVPLLGGVDTRVFHNHDAARALEADDPSGLSEGERGFRDGAIERGNDLKAIAAQAWAIHASPIALDKITAETLVLAGDVDPLAARPEVLAAAIRGARTAIVPGDHTTARLSPEFTRELLAFLR